MGAGNPTIHRPSRPSSVTLPTSRRGGGGGWKGSEIQRVQSVRHAVGKYLSSAYYVPAANGTGQFLCHRAYPLGVGRGGCQINTRPGEMAVRRGRRGLGAAAGRVLGAQRFKLRAETAPAEQERASVPTRRPGPRSGAALRPGAGRGRRPGCPVCGLLSSGEGPRRALA